MSPTFSPTNIAFKRHRSKSETCIGAVFDVERVFEVGFGVRVQESGEKRDATCPTAVRGSVAIVGVIVSPTDFP